MGRTRIFLFLFFFGNSCRVFPGHEVVGTRAQHRSEAGHIQYTWPAVSRRKPIYGDSHHGTWDQRFRTRDELTSVAVSELRISFIPEYAVAVAANADTVAPGSLLINLGFFHPPISVRFWVKYR